MTEEEYRIWWQLHRRVSVGETLSPAEKLAYETGLRTLHAEEHIEGDMKALRQMRNRIQEQEAILVRLQARHDTLIAEIHALESQLDERSRRALGIEPISAG